MPVPQSAARYPRNRVRRFAPLLAAALVLGALPLGAVAQPTLEAEPAVGGFGAPQTGEMRTVAVAALSGWTPLMDDVGYLGALAGRPDQAKGIEGMIAFFTQGKGLVGLDKDKPWGVVVQTNGASVTPLICLPITDLKSMLSIAQGFGVAAEDAGGGVVQITLPNKPPMFAKPMGDWVYVGQAPEQLDAAPADPAAEMAGLIADYDLGVRAFMQNLPALYREMAISGLRQGLQEGLVQEPDETDEQFAARSRLAEAQLDQLVTVINGLDELTIGVGVDESIGKGLVLEFLATGVEGTDVAEQIAALRDASTRFSGFSDESATIQIKIATDTPAEVLEKLKEQNQATLTVARKQLMDLIDKEAEVPNDEARETLKSAVGDLFEVYEEMLLGGKADAALTVNASPTGFKVLGGAAVESPEKVESALKKLSAMVSEEGPAPEVAWAAKTHAGVTFHTVKLPTPPDAAELREMVGDTIELAFGIGDGAVYLAAGSDWYAAVSSAIDASKSAGPTRVEPLVMNFSVRNIAKLSAEFDPKGGAAAQMLADALGDSDDDHVKVTLSGADGGIRYRIQVEEGVLRAAGAIAGQMAQQAGAGGAPPF